MCGTFSLTFWLSSVFARVYCNRKSSPGNDVNSDCQKKALVYVCWIVMLMNMPQTQPTSTHSVREKACQDFHV